ncbi:hypothetical protein ACIQCF_30750 [Streptomyces sp. NPDC088353]|uniref:hypothetical protein n=1 Tax=unclassified Streptomyces TaxID=2593676 RepID=UPI00378EFEF3
MSVSRTALRLLATCVASGALVGAAALPSMAAGNHDRDNGRSFPHSRPAEGRFDHDFDGRLGHFGDRYPYRAWHHHGWYNNRHWDRRHGWDRHHGWYGDRHHFPGRR